MATSYTKRVPQAVLDADREILVFLQSLPDYTPISPSCSLAALQQIAADFVRAQEAELMARRAFEQAREQLAKAGVILHEVILAAKAQVLAQYGDDSPALHAIGRKQKSERRRPSRRAKTTG